MSGDTMNWGISNVLVMKLSTTHDEVRRGKMSQDRRPPSH